MKIGVTYANFNCEGKVSLLSIVFAILHIGKANDEVAALIIFGGITPKKYKAFQARQKNI